MIYRTILTLCLLAASACQGQPSSEEMTRVALEEAEAGVRLYGPGTVGKHAYYLRTALEPTRDVPDVYEVTVLLPPPRYGVGMAEPKAWAYFVRRARDDGRVLNEGLLRMALRAVVDYPDFRITHYFSRERLEGGWDPGAPADVDAWVEAYLRGEDPEGNGGR